LASNSEKVRKKKIFKKAKKLVAFYNYPVYTKFKRRLQVANNIMELSYL
jgi:hypothetical protein